EAIKRLKGRSNSSRFKVIYKVYSTFKYLLTYFISVNFNKPNAPKNYLKINVIVAYIKLLKYYILLKNSPIYYASIVLYLYYKYYFINL
ncbi:hypothetical protein K458DRAFT_303578, partial [Lentithecium fluviatile CBS 122367]